LKATVVKLTRDRVCEARTDNEILFVFSLPDAVDVGIADLLELGRPILEGVLRVQNLTRGGAFETAIQSNDVHDLRLPIRHGGSRTPTIERLNAP